MKRNFHLLIPAAIVVAMALPTADRAEAQDYTWTLGIQGGIGGSLKGGGSAEASFQGGFGIQFEQQAKMWVRVGQSDFSTGSAVGDLGDGSLTYVTAGGEYQFTEAFYESGLFIGLGGYNVDGRRLLSGGVLGPSDEETVLGLALGATGEFKITPSVVVLADLTIHILDHPDLRSLGTFHVGIGFHF